ncbi:MAG TPA: polysaccharide biosynthesis tyrosine autokinase, partial [Actinomycetota bacterium]|nr:polysaccharide biosynthesis tyrosine autokinase [Actinomycetota bacterium]
MAETSPSAVDIRAIFGVLWRRKWSILLITALTTGSALFFSYRRTPIYSSTAEVQVTPLTASQILTTNPYWTLANMDNEIHVVQSAAVAGLANKTMGAEAGSGTLSVQVPTNTQILQIGYSDADPQTARDGAQAYANAYLTYRTKVALNAYTQARQAIQTQIDQLRGDLQRAQAALEAAPAASSDATVAANEIDQISSQIAGLNTQVASLTAPDITPGTLIQPAEVPAVPYSPNHRQDAALGFVAGLVLGVGFAFLRERMDDRIHRRPELEAAVGAPVLAVVPKVKGWRRRSQTPLVTTSASGSPAAEAYRSLRTNLQFISRDGSTRVISVTSPQAGEGKTTTVANLGATLARTGKRVIAVSADLRKPRLHRFFGLANGDGLSTILAGQAQLADVARRVEGLDSLRVVTSGPVPPNPAELLSSDEMEGLLQLLRSTADYVVVDTPPALFVSDAMIVAPRVDGVLIVVDADETTAGAASHAVDQLEQVGAKVIGSVLNGFDASRARYYGRYAYHYHHRYGDSGHDGARSSSENG